MRAADVAACCAFFAACRAPLPPAAPPVAAAPATQPATVTITREQFDKMAVAVVERNRKKNLAMIDCGRDLRIKTDENDAANAVVNQQAAQLRLWQILGPIGLVIAVVGAGLVAHFSR